MLVCGRGFCSTLMESGYLGFLVTALDESARWDAHVESPAGHGHGARCRTRPAT